MPAEIQRDERPRVGTVLVEDYLSTTNKKSLGDCDVNDWRRIMSESLKDLYPDKNLKAQADREFSPDKLMKMSMIVQQLYSGINTFYDLPDEVVNFPGKRRLRETEKFPEIRFASNEATDKLQSYQGYQKNGKGERGVFYINLHELRQEADHFNPQEGIVRQMPSLKRGKTGDTPLYSTSYLGAKFLEGIQLMAWHVYAQKRWNPVPGLFWAGTNKAEAYSSLLDYDTQSRQAYYALLTQALAIQHLVPHPTGRNKNPRDAKNRFNVATVADLWDRVDEGWERVGDAWKDEFGYIHALIDKKFEQDFDGRPGDMREARRKRKEKVA